MGWGFVKVNEHFITVRTFRNEQFSNLMRFCRSVSSLSIKFTCIKHPDTNPPAHPIFTQGWVLDSSMVDCLASITSAKMTNLTILEAIELVWFNFSLLGWVGGNYLFTKIKQKQFLIACWMPKLIIFMWVFFFFYVSLLILSWGPGTKKILPAAENSF